MHKWAAALGVSCFRICHNILLVALLLLSGCSSIQRTPVPGDLHLQTTVLGSGDLRYWGDEKYPSTWWDFDKLSREELARRYPAITSTEHNYLAISGGGARGAYGAGVLVGWSEAGTRPEFALVTGVSTGALAAPFAFLGSDYDAQLKEIYTTLDTSAILRRRSPFAILGGDSVVNVTPLVNMLEKYITDELIQEIAAKYRAGKSLLIGTTNLDAGRPVTWDIGRIANSGQAGAPALIRKVLLASASIPGVFPPAYIKVQGPDGKTYDEMHVDGGVSSQIFLYPTDINWSELTQMLQVRGPPKAYLIRNSHLYPDYESVDPRLIPIMGKTVEILIRSQSIGDMFRIYAIASRDGLDLRLTWIPRDAVDVRSNEAFDPVYMSALFEYGYNKAREGGGWVDVIEAVDYYKSQ
jgi:predicted patatin/cPLA2 family phospholipase